MSKQSLLTSFLKRPDKKTSTNDVSPAPAAAAPADISDALPAATAPASHSGAESSSKHRVTGVNPEWFTVFKWLSVEQKGAQVGMLCDVCRKYAVPSSRYDVFIRTPCTRIRRESLAEHEKTDLHKKSVQKALQATDFVTAGVGQIEKTFSLVSNLQRDAFIGALKTMYFLIKNELSHTTLYEKLLEHAKLMGCKYLENLNVAKNANYTSERIMQELAEVLSSQIRNITIRKIADSPFISILCDETTDITVLKQLILYIKFLDVKNKKSDVRFLSITPIPNGTAVTIFDTIKSEILKYNIDKKKIVGLGSDGAAVMIGEHNGVAKLLRDETHGLLLNCHCISHRLALASAQAANDVAYLKKFKDYLRQIFNFFHKSPVRSASLNEIQNLLNQPHMSIKMASDTRWLSHDAAIHSLRESLVSVVAALEREAAEKNEATAVGLLKFMKSYEFVGSLLMFSDVLPILSKLSKAWQKKDINFTVIKEILEATKQTLTQLKNHPGNYFSSFSLKLTNEWKDFGIKEDSAKIRSFKENIYDVFFNNLLIHLERRFPNMDIYEAFSIFNPEFLTSNSDEVCNKKFDLLVKHFSKNGNPPPIDNEISAKTEWQLISVMIKGDSYRSLSWHETLIKLATTSELQDCVPQISKLAQIGLILPVSTVECERGFSALKRIKTDLRSRLKEETLNNLMNISIEGCEPANFDYEQAAEAWSTKKKRRIMIDTQ